MLGTSRGGFDKDKIMQACIDKGINQLYIIGGDGTHRAADVLYQEASVLMLLARWLVLWIIHATTLSDCRFLIHGLRCAGSKAQVEDDDCRHSQDN